MIHCESVRPSRLDCLTHRALSCKLQRNFTTPAFNLGLLFTGLNIFGSILSLDDELIFSCFDSLLDLDNIGQVWYGDRWSAAPPSDGEVAVSEDPSDDSITDTHSLDSLKAQVGSRARNESMLEYYSLVGDSEFVAPASKPGEWEHDQFDWVEVFNFGEVEEFDRLFACNVCLVNVAHSFVGLLVCWFVG